REQWALIMGNTDKDGKRVDGEVDKLKRQVDFLERREAAEAELRAPVTPPAATRQLPGREDGPAAQPPERIDPEDDTEALSLAELRRNLSNEDRALSIQAWFQQGRVPFRVSSIFQVGRPLRSGDPTMVARQSPTLAIVGRAAKAWRACGSGGNGKM